MYTGVLKRAWRFLRFDLYGKRRRNDGCFGRFAHIYIEQIMILSAVVRVCNETEFHVLCFIYFAKAEVYPVKSQTFGLLQIHSYGRHATMAPQSSSKKRKAVTRDSPEADEVLLSDGGDDFETALLNGIQSQSEDEIDKEYEDVSSDLLEGDSNLEDEGGSEDDIDSDEVPSEVESDLLYPTKDGIATSSAIEGKEDAEGPPANYKITEDANGNPRYVYTDIDPVYDTDDSDAPATQNTIGNIPLSFYDSYPHIGYDINGKKIARPAKGEALDALLDSIEVPKGWTGLTDPATGEPLELSQQECVTSESMIPLLGVSEQLFYPANMFHGSIGPFQVGYANGAIVIQA